MSEKNPIRVFVTHTFSESDDYLRIFEFLESVDRFFYFNVSKPENIPTQGGLEAIKDELIAQIKESEVVIVVSDALAEKPDLVNYMLDVADANDINSLSIQPFGHIGETPPKIRERVKDDVEWNARAMADSIRFQARGKETSRWEVIDFPGFDSDGNEIENN